MRQHVIVVLERGFYSIRVGSNAADAPKRRFGGTVVRRAPSRACANNGGEPMNKLIRAAVVTVLCAAGSVALADASGTWTASFETQVGTQSYTFELKVDGDMLTGMAKSNLVGEVELEDGKVDGNTITFVENGTYQGMPISFSYTGELVGDDEIHFSRVLMGFEAEEFVAKRSD
jgi:hypothetical protein